MQGPAPNVTMGAVHGQGPPVGHPGNYPQQQMVPPGSQMTGGPQMRPQMLQRQLSGQPMNPNANHYQSGHF